jgi:parallel beta-helix repeat protein
MRHVLPRARLALGTLLPSVLTLGLAASPASAGASGGTWYVAPTGSGGGSCATPDSHTIQGAVDAAAPGATILVCPGVYQEDVTVSTNGLTIRAKTPWKAILEPAFNVTGAAPALDGSFLNVLTIDNASHVTVQWLRFAAPTHSPCELVRSMVDVTDGATHAIVRGNKMRPIGTETFGACGYEDGVIVEGGSRALVGYNVVKDFQVAGIEVDGAGTRAGVIHNSVRFFHAQATSPLYSTAVGIYVHADGVAQVKHNAVVGLPGVLTTPPATPRLLYGIFEDSPPHRVAVLHNYVTNLDTGILVNFVGHSLVRHNVVRNATVGDLWFVGFHDGRIIGNTGRNAHNVGIYLDASEGNIVRDNDARAHAITDCYDDTTGAGTGSTANTWSNDRGRTANVAGICHPGNLVF